MSVVTITLNGKQFQIGCNDGEELLLQSAAEKLQDRIAQMREASPKATTEMLLIFCALALQDENTEICNKLDSKGYSDDEKISETLSTIANYLDELAHKITK
jgi:cell division protein ZapA (FtsZ GTPase activity inhibitor)